MTKYNKKNKSGLIKDKYIAVKLLEKKIKDSTLEEKFILADILINSYREIICIYPEVDSKEYFYLRIGKIFLEFKKDYDNAISTWKTGLSLFPRSFRLNNILGDAYKNKDELKIASRYYQRSIELSPNFNKSKVSLAFVNIKLGNYEIGWREFEWLSRNWERARMFNPIPKTIRWDGSPLTAGDELLIMPEGGIGDFFQFIRYALYLKNKSINITICSVVKLHSIISISGLADKIITPKEVNSYTSGKWIPIFSLPHCLGVRTDNIIISHPYLSTSNTLIKKWQINFLKEKKPIIGINWQGNPNTEKNQAHLGRSLPLELFYLIAKNIDCSLVSLQKGFGSEQFVNCSFKEKFVALQEQICKEDDFLETAAVISNCDLIITSDTMVAHLAGAIGKKTWVLLKTASDYRWGVKSNQTCWYPTVRLFRQKNPGDWNEVMHRVVRELKKDFN